MRHMKRVLLVADMSAEKVLGGAALAPLSCSYAGWFVAGQVGMGNLRGMLCMGFLGGLDG